MVVRFRTICEVDEAEGAKLRETTRDLSKRRAEVLVRRDWTETIDGLLIRWNGREFGSQHVRLEGVVGDESTKAVTGDMLLAQSDEALGQ